MEITQFTYFQQVGGIECDPVSAELTYGLERLAMYVQGVENVYDLAFNGAGVDAMATCSSAPSANSPPTISSTPTPRCCSAISPTPRRNASALLDRQACRCRPTTSASRPATSSICSMRAASIRVTERAAYIGRVRALAKACCEAWLAGEGDALG